MPDKSAPAPSRGTLLRKAASAADNAADEVGQDEEEDMDDLMPRTDISGKLTEELITKLGDANWKIRKEALDEVKAIFEANKFVTSNLGHLPQARVRKIDYES